MVRPEIYARIMCSELPEDSEVGHSCAHGSGHHDILVVLTKTDNWDLYIKLLAWTRSDYPVPC